MPKKEPDEVSASEETEFSTETPDEVEAEEQAMLLVDQLARRHEARTRGESEKKPSSEKPGIDVSDVPKHLQDQLESLRKQNENLMDLVAKMQGKPAKEKTDDDDDEEYIYEVEGLPEHLNDIAPALKDLGVHVDGRLRPVEKMLKKIEDGFNQWKTDFDVWRFGQENPNWKDYKAEIQTLSQRHPELLDSYEGMTALLRLAKSERDSSELEELRAERKRGNLTVMQRLRPARTESRQSVKKAKSLDEALEQAAARMQREGLL